MSTSTSTSTPTTPLSLLLLLQSQSALYGNLSTIPSPQTWPPPPNSGGHLGRYLWTDAIGVLNFITLHKETSKHSASAPAPDPTTPLPYPYYLTLASRLVESVHTILGRTRDQSHLLPRATAQSPLAGGLRIGKLDDTGPDADGQYHHYLTLWMFALNRLAVATRDGTFNAQAVALAKAIHPRFVRKGAGAGGESESERPRMVWKMDVSLEKALVAAQGNLDPVDGFVVFRLLRAAAKVFGNGEGGDVLSEEIEDYRRMIGSTGEHVVSRDTLDLGMTLWTVHWFVEREGWARRVAGKAMEQVYNVFEKDRFLSHNIQYRLAFREFGTALGMQCMAAQETEKESAVDLKNYAQGILDAWASYMKLSFEMDVPPQDIRPITQVMYGAALIPGAFQRGYLGLEPEVEVEKELK